MKDEKENIVDRDLLWRKFQERLDYENRFENESKIKRFDKEKWVDYVKRVMQITENLEKGEDFKDGESEENPWGTESFNDQLNYDPKVKSQEDMKETENNNETETEETMWQSMKKAHEMQNSDWMLPDKNTKRQEGIPTVERSEQMLNRNQENSVQEGLSETNARPFEMSEEQWKAMAKYIQEGGNPAGTISTNPAYVNQVEGGGVQFPQLERVTMEKEESRGKRLEGQRQEQGQEKEDSRRLEGQRQGKGQEKEGSRGRRLEQGPGTWANWPGADLKWGMRSEEDYETNIFA